MARQDDIRKILCKLGPTWVVYPEDVKLLLVEGYLNNEDIVDFSMEVDNVDEKHQLQSYSVDFVNMIQTNKYSNKTRKIRLLKNWEKKTDAEDGYKVMEGRLARGAGDAKPRRERRKSNYPVRPVVGLGPTREAAKEVVCNIGHKKWAVYPDDVQEVLLDDYHKGADESEFTMTVDNVNPDHTVQSYKIDYNEMQQTNMFSKKKRQVKVIKANEYRAKGENYEVMKGKLAYAAGKDDTKTQWRHEERKELHTLHHKSRRIDQKEEERSAARLLELRQGAGQANEDAVAREREIELLEVRLKEKQKEEQKRLQRLAWEKENWRAPEYNMIYCSAGRSEALRLCFVYTDTPFSEEFVPSAQTSCYGVPLEWGMCTFLSKEMQGYNTFDQWALMRYIGIQQKIYPLNELGEKADVDEIMSSLRDFNMDYYKLKRKKKPGVGELMANEMTKYERLIPKTEGPWLLQRLYICDFELVATLKTLLSDKHTDDAMFQEAYPGLMNIYNKMRLNKKVRNYDDFRRVHS